MASSACVASTQELREGLLVASSYLSTNASAQRNLCRVEAAPVVRHLLGQAGGLGRVLVLLASEAEADAARLAQVEVSGPSQANFLVPRAGLRPQLSDVAALRHPVQAACVYMCWRGLAVSMWRLSGVALGFLVSFCRPSAASVTQCWRRLLRRAGSLRRRWWRRQRWRRSLMSSGRCVCVERPCWWTNPAFPYTHETWVDTQRLHGSMTWRPTLPLARGQENAALQARFKATRKKLKSAFEVLAAANKDLREKLVAAQVRASSNCHLSFHAAQTSPASSATAELVCQDPPPWRPNLPAAVKLKPRCCAAHRPSGEAAAGANRVRRAPDGTAPA